MFSFPSGEMNVIPVDICTNFHWLFYNPLPHHSIIHHLHLPSHFPFIESYVAETATRCIRGHVRTIRNRVQNLKSTGPYSSISLSHTSAQRNKFTFVFYLFHGLRSLLRLTPSQTLAALGSRSAARFIDLSTCLSVCLITISLFHIMEGEV